MFFMPIYNCRKLTLYMYEAWLHTEDKSILLHSVPIAINYFDILQTIIMSHNGRKCCLWCYIFQFLWFPILKEERHHFKYADLTHHYIVCLRNSEMIIFFKFGSRYVPLLFMSLDLAFSSFQTLFIKHSIFGGAHELIYFAEIHSQS